MNRDSYFRKTGRVNILDSLWLIEQQNVWSDSNYRAIFHHVRKVRAVPVPQPLPQPPKVREGCDERTVVLVQTFLIPVTGDPQANYSHHKRGQNPQRDFGCEVCDEHVAAVDCKEWEVRLLCASTGATSLNILSDGTRALAVVIALESMSTFAMLCREVVLGAARSVINKEPAATPP